MTLPLAHSLGMLLAVAIAWALRDARIVAGFGVATLVVFAARELGSFRIGAANAITAFRLVLVGALALSPGSGAAPALLVLGILVLDGADGALARRLGTATAFGAAFDMETDALLVLVSGFRLAEGGRLPLFVLVPGVLRYAYAASLVLFPHAVGEAPRTRLGRAGFLVVALAAAAGFVLPTPLARPLALFATVYVTLSFGHSAYWSFFRRAEIVYDAPRSSLAPRTPP